MVNAFAGSIGVNVLTPESILSDVQDSIDNGDLTFFYQRSAGMCE